MATDSDVRNRLAAVLSGQLNLDVFEEWLFSHTSIDDSPYVMRIVGVLAEFAGFPAVSAIRTLGSLVTENIAILASSSTAVPEVIDTAGWFSTELPQESQSGNITTLLEQESVPA